MAYLGQVTSGTIANLDIVRVWFKSDLITEGSQTATFNVRTGSTAGPSVASSSVTVNDTSVYPAAGTTSGNPYCVGFNKYQNYNDGSGGTYSSLRETNSAYCGYTSYSESITISSDLWGDYIVPTGGYFTLSITGGAPGTGFTYAITNNADPQPATFPSSGTLDGLGNFSNYLLGSNVIGSAGATGDKRIWIKFNYNNNIRSARILVVLNPGTLSGGQYCSGTTLYQNKNDGRGGVYAEVVQYNSVSCGYVQQYYPQPSAYNWYYYLLNSLADTWAVYNAKPYSSVKYTFVAGPILVGSTVTVQSDANGYAYYIPNVAAYPEGIYTINITFPGNDASYPSSYRTLVVYWNVLNAYAPGYGGY